MKSQADLKIQAELKRYLETNGLREVAGIYIQVNKTIPLSCLLISALVLSFCSLLPVISDSLTSR